MGISAREFIKQNPATALRRRGVRRSKMAPHASDLQQLREQGCTLASLQDFLAKNGIDVQISTISMFLTNLEKANSAPSGRL